MECSAVIRDVSKERVTGGGTLVVWLHRGVVVGHPIDHDHFGRRAPLDGMEPGGPSW